MKPIVCLTISTLLGLVTCEAREPGAAAPKAAADTAPAAVSQHEKLAGEIMDAMKELAETLTAVKDLETAKAASTKIEVLGKRFEAIAAQLTHLTPPDDKLRAKINEKMDARDKEMEAVMGNVMEKKMKELAPDAAAVLMESLGAFFQKMGKAGQEFERHFKPAAK